MNAARFNLISNYFKRRAQLLSFVVGVILAIVVNINGIRLFERYLSDPELTATVIAQSDNIESALASAQKRQAAESDKEADNIREIKAALNQFNKLMGNFMGQGLPIGWNFYPNCPTDQNPTTLKNYDPQCKTAVSFCPVLAPHQIFFIFLWQSVPICVNLRLKIFL